MLGLPFPAGIVGQGRWTEDYERARDSVDTAAIECGLGGLRQRRRDFGLAEQDGGVAVEPQVADRHRVDDEPVAFAFEGHVVDVLEQEVVAGIVLGDVLGLDESGEGGPVTVDSTLGLVTVCDVTSGSSVVRI